MANTFFISDTHFSHANIIKFTDRHGDRIRPFDSTEEMDELIVDNWNRTVGDKDRVWCLGDVVMNRRFLPIIDRLKGRKKLVMGNHDIFDAKEFLKFFEDVKGLHVFDRCIVSHIPIHVDCLGRFRFNIHGHLHQNRIMLDGKIDPRFQSVCVEQTNFTPISFDDIVKRRDSEVIAFG